MVRSALVIPGVSPTRESLVGALMDATELWDGLTEQLRLQMGARGTWAWGGPKYGWEQRFKRAGRPFVTLTPEGGAFTALVILGREEAERAGRLSLGERARRTYDDARQYHDGRWLYLRVETANDAADVRALLLEKLPPTLRARSLADGESLDR
jgi:hypothetical protein